MPYHLEKVGRKYLVITTATGAAHSKKPMTKKNAEAQLRILNAHTDIVEHLGGFLGLPEQRVSAADRTAEDIQQEQDTAEIMTGLITGEAGLIVDAARMISKAPGVEGFMNSIGIQSAAQRQGALDAERAKQFQAYMSQEGIQHRLEMGRRGQKANLDAARAMAARQRLRSPAQRDFTDEEIQDILTQQAAETRKQETGRVLHDLQRKKLEADLNAERIAKQRQATLEQNQQQLSGLNQKSLAVQAQVTSVKESLAKAKILQQQRFKDQQLFVTKAADIVRNDFFNKERVAAEARQAMIDAEQRRQAIKAAAQAAAAQKPNLNLNPNPVPIMVPTLGRRLPPSVLWHG